MNYNEFMKTNSYKTFIDNNPSFSILKIRTTSASSAIPISGVKITVSKEIDNNKVIFYTGLTDESGMINNINLPAPSKDANDLVEPRGILYDIEANFNDFNKKYSVIMYPGIYTIQNINIIPNINTGSDYYGS